MEKQLRKLIKENIREVLSSSPELSSYITYVDQNDDDPAYYSIKLDSGVTYEKFMDSPIEDFVEFVSELVLEYLDRHDSTKVDILDINVVEGGKSPSKLQPPTMILTLDYSLQ